MAFNFARISASRAALSLHKFGLHRAEYFLQNYRLNPSSDTLHPLLHYLKTEEHALQIANRVDKMTPLASELVPKPVPQDNIRLVANLMLGNCLITQINGNVKTEQSSKVFAFVSTHCSKAYVFKYNWESESSNIPNILPPTHYAKLYFTKLESTLPISEFHKSIEELLTKSFYSELNECNEFLLDVSESSSAFSPCLEPLLNDLVTFPGFKISLNDAKWCLAFACSFPSMNGFNMLHQSIESSVS